MSLLDCHDWNNCIISKSTQLALRTITELPLIWFGSIIDVDCWVVYIMKDINLNWFHWQWGCSGHMNKEWSSILKYENNGFESCQKYLNLKEINHSTVKKIEITTQNQFQILCEQLPLIPGKKPFYVKLKSIIHKKNSNRCCGGSKIVQITVLVEKGSSGSEARGKLEPGVGGTSSKYDWQIRQIHFTIGTNTFNKVTDPNPSLRLGSRRLTGLEYGAGGAGKPVRAVLLCLPTQCLPTPPQAVPPFK